jgi:GDSL-like Lipase/Acylhydrolase family
MIPADLLTAEYALPQVAAAVKAGRLTIAVLGSGSSSLPGPDGAKAAYPARLQAALAERLSGLAIKLTVAAKSGETAASMAGTLTTLLANTKPDLVIWQTGTVEAMRGIDPDVFWAALDDGLTTLQTGGADVILMNMQYSPRTEFVVAIARYVDDMQAVAQQHDVLLFNRLAIMRHWNDTGQFDLFQGTRDNVMAKTIHDCIGRGLATLILEAAHLESGRGGNVQ